MDTAERMAERVELLLARGAQLSTGPEETARSVGRLLLAPIGRMCLRGGTSTLNADGSPLQVCLSSRSDGIAVRLIGDPAWEAGQPRERFQRGRAALANVLAVCDAMALQPLLQQLLDSFAGNENDIDRFHHGFWIAAGASSPGVALYLDGGALGEEAWDRVEAWLAATVSDAGPASAAIAALRGHARLSSIGIEGTSPADARAKLYFRLRRPARLDSLGVPLLGSQAMATLLVDVVGARTMKLSGAVLGVGFAIGSGALVDAKLDLCAHCTPRSHAEWWSVWSRISRACGVAPFPERARQMLADDDVRPSFTGVGIDVDGRRRVNIYLKAGRTTAIEQSLASSARAAIDAAVGYCASIMKAEGAWEDYHLPVGRATDWVTAFLGLALARIGDRHARARQLAERAAAWLLARRATGFGWGYNAMTGPDADSTAFALRLLAQLGIPAPADAEAWLLTKWRAGGGFATYDGPSFWGDAHPCVTAAAFQALSPSARAPRLDTLVRYLGSCRRADGTWPSYWWRTHHYSTWHALGLFGEVGIDVTPPTTEEPPAEESAFVLAFAVGIEHRARGATAHGAHLLNRLLAAQEHDGSFAGAANLRVTDPECAHPWEHPRGKLYVDGRATITTATALFTLQEIAYD